MKRERTYRRRNRLVQLEEVTDLIAVRPPKASRSLPLAFEAERGGGEQAKAAIPEELVAQVRAIEDSGWTLMPVSANRRLPNDAVRAKVFLQAGGRLALDAGNLTVKFTEDVDREKAGDILRGFGCQILEPLTFAKGMFRVAVEDPKDQDTLDVANALSESELVEFAEPELIEVTGHRGR